MITLHCPTCGQSLTVSPSAPARLRCPNCLGRVENSRAGQSVLSAPPIPMPVIPLDDQVQRDTRFGTVAIIVIGILAFGGLMLVLTPMVGQSSNILITVGLAVAMVVAALLAVVRMKSQSAEPSPALEGMSYLGQAIGGILLGIAVAAGLCVASRGGELVFVGIVTPAVVGIVIVCSIRPLRGFGLGLILAVPMAFLLLIGFCFVAIAGSNFH